MFVWWGGGWTDVVEGGEDGPQFEGGAEFHTEGGGEV